VPGLWSGSITFGLVSIPVRLEVSQHRKNLGFNPLHQDCLQRINQKYHAPHVKRMSSVANWSEAMSSRRVATPLSILQISKPPTERPLGTSR